MLLSVFGEGQTDVAQRQLRYVISRAQLVQRRKRIDAGIRPAWRNQMVAASLWLEAAEIAGALDQIELTRDYVMRAARHLLDLQLPAGAALDLLLLGRRRSLRSRSGVLIESWLYPPEASQADTGEEDRTLQEPARVQPQQVAYMALAAEVAQSDVERRGRLMDQLALLRSAPFGRQQMPLDDLREILSAGRNSRAPGKAGEERLAAIDSIARLMGELYRAIRLAESNEYLWQQGLSPIPVFDLDIAMLIAFLARTLNREEMMLGLTRGMDGDERRYASEFVATALKLA